MSAMQRPETEAAIQTTMVACHQERPAPTMLEPSVLQGTSVWIAAYNPKILGVPVAEPHAKPEETEIVPLPVDHVGRRRLEILVGPGVKRMGIALGVYIFRESLRRVECVAKPTCPIPDGVDERGRQGTAHGEEGRRP